MPPKHNDDDVSIANMESYAADPTVNIDERVVEALRVYAGKLRKGAGAGRRFHKALMVCDCVICVQLRETLGNP